MKVDQLIGGAGPVDAVTQQALAWRRVFDGWGWTGGNYAETLAPGMERMPVRPLADYAGDGVTLVHYSGYAPAIEDRVTSPWLLLSHNITPARYFWELEPATAIGCALGERQLAAMAARADAAAGVSAFNAADLGRDDAQVIPILFDRGALPAPAALPDGPPTVLFVGRIAPHKRQDLVVRAFAIFRARHAPDARLELVGTPLSPDYGARMRALADEVAPGAVCFASGLSPAELHDRYRSAHVYLCLSEHEGFCIPLLEAFHFGVPVIARAAAGVPDVVGDAGVLVTAEDDLPVVAELLALATTETGLRATLAERAQGRLEHFDSDRVAGTMRAALEAL